MHRISYLATVASAALLGASLSGIALAAAPSKTISFAFWGDTQEHTAMVAAVAAFDRAHPNIHVTAEWVTGNYNEKILTELAGGDAPDVMQISNADLPGYTQAFQPIKHLNASPYLDVRLVNELKVKGTLYAYPFDVNPKVTVINVGLFKQDHVPLPSLTTPMTPAQFKSDAMKLTHGTGKTEVFGSAPLWYGDWVYMFGGRFFNNAGTQCLLGSKQDIAAANFVINSSTKFKYAPTAKEAAGQNTFDWFLSGKVATYTDTGPWYLPTLLTAKGLQWELIPEPGYSPFAEVDGLAVNRASKESAVANEFAKWMSTAPAAQAAIGESTQAGYVPVVKAAVPGFLKTDPGHNLQAFITAAENNVHDGEPTIKSNQINSEMWDDFDNATAMGSGSQAPSKVFPKIARQIDALLQP